MKTKEILQKNMGLKQSRVSLCSNLDTKLEEILETALPLPPQELILQELQSTCDDECCQATRDAQYEKIKKMQDLCQLYYKHIQDLHSVIQQQKSLATPKTSSVKRFSTVSSGNSSARGHEYLSKIESCQSSSKIIKKSQIITQSR
jgi:hypothetical protein